MKKLQNITNNLEIKEIEQRLKFLMTKKEPLSDLEANEIKEKLKIIMKEKKPLLILETQEKLEALNKEYAVALSNFQKAKEDFDNKFPYSKVQEIMTEGSKTLAQQMDSAEYKNVEALACIKNVLQIRIHRYKSTLCRQEKY
jgi:hypothetical protein